MIGHVAHILPLTKIRRERLLPIPGNIVVAKGQDVRSTDVVAEANFQAKHMFLDVYRGLGMTRERADEEMHCEIGDRVAKGDLLAGPVGLSKRVVRAPVNGRVAMVGDGQILFEIDTDPYQLKAGQPGTIIELVGDLGVVIETVGALIQGVWGNGLLGHGNLKVIEPTGDDSLINRQIDASLKGSVIYADHCSDFDVLDAAADRLIRGLILSSMGIDLMSRAFEMPFPIVIIEGFGRQPINSIVYDTLLAHNGEDISINGESWDRFRGVRPEVIIPLSTLDDPSLPSEVNEFVSGQRVRVIRKPHLREVGSLVEVLPGFATLPSGVSAHAAQVHLESGDYAIIPLANLEILE